MLELTVLESEVLCSQNQYSMVSSGASCLSSAFPISASQSYPGETTIGVSVRVPPHSIPGLSAEPTNAGSFSGDAFMIWTLVPLELDRDLFISRPSDWQLSCTSNTSLIQRQCRGESSGSHYHSHKAASLLFCVNYSTITMNNTFKINYLKINFLHV